MGELAYGSSQLPGYQVVVMSPKRCITCHKSEDSTEALVMTSGTLQLHTVCMCVTK